MILNSSQRKVLISSLAFLTLAAGAETKLNGFVDVQYAGKTGAWKQDGFFINDGALYVDHSSDKSEFMLDLPFATSNAGTNNTFSIAEEKAQAFFKYSVSKQFSAQAGQFDTPFGFEANDSKDLHFSTGGLLWENVLPTTHTGAMLAYSHGSASLNFIVADPKKQGHLNRANPDLGLQASYQLQETSTVTAGVLVTPDGSNTKTLVDVMGGLAIIKDLRADLEFDFINDPKLASPTLGYLVFLTETVTKGFDIAGRVEYLFNGTDDETPAHSQFELAVGPKYAVNENLALKAEYDLTLTKTKESSSNVVGNGVRVSGVYSF